MGYALMIGRCGACNGVMTFNPMRVPAEVPVVHQRFGACFWSVLRRNRNCGGSKHFQVTHWQSPGLFLSAHGLMRDRIQEAPPRASLNGSRSFVSRLARRPGLVAMRQTFVRWCQTRVARERFADTAPTDPIGHSPQPKDPMALGGPR
jgi:hypothetical protein